MTLGEHDVALKKREKTSNFTDQNSKLMNTSLDQNQQHAFHLCNSKEELHIPGSRGTADINSKVAVTLSPGITIFTFSGNSTLPVTSAVLK